MVTPSAAGGNHGWDPTPPQHACLLREWAGIPPGKVPTFENVTSIVDHELLGLQPAPGIAARKAARQAMTRLSIPPPFPSRLGRRADAPRFGRHGLKALRFHHRPRRRRPTPGRQASPACRPPGHATPLMPSPMSDAELGADESHRANRRSLTRAVRSSGLGTPESRATSWRRHHTAMKTSLDPGSR